MSLVASIVWLCGIGSVVALITGYMAHQQIKERGESGDGMAVAGMVIGGLGVIIAIFYIVGLAATSGSSGYYY